MMKWIVCVWVVHFIKDRYFKSRKWCLDTSVAFHLGARAAIVPMPRCSPAVESGAPLGDGIWGGHVGAGVQVVSRVACYRVGIPLRQSRMVPEVGPVPRHGQGGGLVCRGWSGISTVSALV